jgi:formylglycine-generating enzyme
MGSPSGEKDRSDDEGPTHQVTIGASFAVGKLAVTRGQFAAFVNDSGYTPGTSCTTITPADTLESAGKSFRDPGFKQDDSHPAVCISWDDANAYVAWLGKKTGKAYRLLTEAEYEYADRAGTQTPYWFGSDGDKLCGYANGADATLNTQFTSADTATCKDGYVYTAPGGSFAANDFGLYDMAGNVWEWTEDCYHESYDGAPGDGSAWTAGDCSERVLRGGSWVSNPQYLRSASRGGSSTGGRLYSYGFRVARTLTR